MIPLDLLGSALAAGCVGAAALPRGGSVVHAALCALGDAAAAGGLGVDAGRGALWHLAWQWPGVCWGLPRGGGGVSAGAFGAARLGPAPVGAVPQAAGGGAGREQGGPEVGVVDAPLTRLPLLAAQPGLRPQ